MMIRLLMIGPLPPKIGGIASYIRDIKQELESSGNIQISLLEPYVIESGSLSKALLKGNRLSKNCYHIVKSCLKNSFDIAHIHTSSYVSFLENSIYIIILKDLFGKKIILHIHAPDLDHFLEDGIYLPIFMYISKKCDVIITLSSYWKTVISNSIPNRDSIIVLRNAASRNFYYINEEDCRRDLCIPQDINVIFSLGNLIERKGFNYLIEAISILASKRTDFLCIIGGSGPLYDVLVDKIYELNLGNYIIMPGFIPDDLINIYINASNIIVLPSLAEGEPILLFETLNCGKPFIGTAVGGISEVVISEDYGFLAKPGNSQELAHQIDAALNKNWNRNKILIYAKEFTFERIAKELIYLYDSVVNEHPDGVKMNGKSR